MLAVALLVTLSTAVPEAQPVRVAFKRTKPQTEPTKRGEAIAAMWERVFAAPALHLWDFDVSAGWQYWERAHGARIDSWLFRVTARRQLTELPGGNFLGAAAFCDASWLNVGTNQLDIDQTRFMFGLGVGLLRWQNRFRFDATLESGALVRSTTIADGVSANRHATVVDAAIGATAGAAVAIAGRALVGLRGGVRYHPGRLDALLMLDLGWLLVD